MRQRGSTSLRKSRVVFTISATVPGAAEGSTAAPKGVMVEPVSVTLDGITENDTIETTAWEYEWSNLPKYDTAGKLITYTVEETAYTIGTAYTATTFPSAVVTTEGNTTVYTFTNDLPTRNIVVEKEWSPAGWPSEIESVTVGLYKTVNGTESPVTTGDPAVFRFCLIPQKK